MFTSKVLLDLRLIRASALLSSQLRSTFYCWHADQARTPGEKPGLTLADLGEADGNGDGNDGNQPRSEAHVGSRRRCCNVPGAGRLLHLKSGRSAVRPCP